MTSSTVGSTVRVEPTVLGAMRRHWILVYVVVLASMVLALGVATLMPQQYRASVTVSSPRPAGSVLQSDQQYLDSQVMLLNSRQVGDLALVMVRRTEAGSNIARADLAPTVGEVEIIPPPGNSSDSYGSTIVTIGFTAPSAAEAQAGVTALAAAYDQVRSEQIAAQAQARLAGIDHAIAATNVQEDLAALRRERARALIDQGRDFALTASIGSAERPKAPTGSSLLSLFGAGLCFGLLGGGTAAFVRASRLQHVGTVELGQRVYGAPLLGERLTADPRRDPADLTEQDNLLGRAVAHRLKAFDESRCLAVVATPANQSRSISTAHLALALARQDVQVLAVDGDSGTMARRLGGVEPPTAWKKVAGPEARRSLLHPCLSVLDVSGDLPARTSDADTDAGVVVVDCPPPATSAKAVDLLSQCDAAVVLVRADDPVRDHLEVARWLDLTGTPVLGYIFSPYTRRGPRRWRTRRARSLWPAPAPAIPVALAEQERRTAALETLQLRAAHGREDVVQRARR